MDGCAEYESASGCLYMEFADKQSLQDLLAGDFTVEEDRSPVVITRGDQIFATIGQRITGTGGMEENAGVTGCSVEPIADRLLVLTG